MWTKNTPLTALLFIARFGSGVEATLHSPKSNKSPKSGKVVCVEYGIKYDVNLPVGPIPPPDATCIPPGFQGYDGSYDPDMCPVYFEPLWVEGLTQGSSQYEQVDGIDAICMVNPLTDTPADKFFMTYFGSVSSDPNDTSGLLYPDTPLSDFDQLSYDFYVKECQGTKTSCPEQFYTGVYAREDVNSTNFFDCRFNYVPATGGDEGTWTTFSFTADTPGRACGYKSGTADCSQRCVPAWAPGEKHSLNEYIAETAGTAVLSSLYAQAWNLNMGDSAASDKGLQGCYGDIRFTLDGNTEVLQFTQD